MWLDKKEQSEWAYEQCLKLKKENKEDIDEIWKLITDSYDAYWYCRCVKDRPEVRKYIKEETK